MVLVCEPPHPAFHLVQFSDQRVREVLPALLRRLCGVVAHGHEPPLQLDDLRPYFPQHARVASVHGNLLVPLHVVHRPGFVRIRLRVADGRRLVLELDRARLRPRRRRGVDRAGLGPGRGRIPDGRCVHFLATARHRRIVVGRTRLRARADGSPLQPRPLDVGNGLALLGPLARGPVLLLLHVHHFARRAGLVELQRVARSRTAGAPAPAPAPACILVTVPAATVLANVTHTS